MQRCSTLGTASGLTSAKSRIHPTRSVFQRALWHRADPRGTHWKGAFEKFMAALSAGIAAE